MSFVVFELSVYVLAMLCLRQALRRGRFAITTLLAGMVYGVLLEYATILNYQAYTYGHFLVILFGAVPLCIGVSWGIIIYTVMETSDRLGLPVAVRPLLDTLLALTIDMSMDAVAIRLGFWTWGTNGAWFGVPLGNFYGWFWVVLSFSLLLRLGRRWLPRGRRGWLGDIVLPVLAVPVSVLILIQALAAYGWLVQRGLSDWLIVGLPIVVSTLAVLPWLWSARQDHDVDLLILAVPFFFHLFFFSALFWAGIAIHLPVLVVISLVLMLLGMLPHLWPARARLLPGRITHVPDESDRRGTRAHPPTVPVHRTEAAIGHGNEKS